MSKISYLLSTSLMLALFAGYCQAAEKMENDSFQPPASGLSFSIFTDNYYGTVAPGLKFWYLKWRDESNGWRLGTSISGSMEDSESERNQDYFSNENTDQRQKITEKRKNINLEIAAQYLKRYEIVGKISCILGIGPTIGWENTQVDHERVVFYAVESTQEEHTSNFLGGLYSSFGLQWHFNQRMALASEYGLSLMYNWSLDDEKTFTDDYDIYDKDTGSGFQISTSLVRLSLIYYFK